METDRWRDLPRAPMSKRVFPKVPRCPECGFPLQAFDLWLLRNSRSLGSKTCGRCIAKLATDEETKSWAS
jgi:hypothetical protein